MKYLLTFLLLTFSFSTSAIADMQSGFDQCGFDRFIVAAEEDDKKEGEDEGEDEDEEPDCE